ncbi:MarR family transcriptional regulator [Pseudomonas asiatica]|uniref:Transcriptional regulator, MarR family n=1 Tax=Paraburkholderia phytofirmans (strain DSM 17436 / LMG 22146 / PsJN) TaxID=398527 RepID=B2TGY9_PARPJ|nr:MULTISPECIES: MarR family transcriptional regulator [Pseudomonadota]ACD21538.1 transcriptional regulator, MarR family [Paraburkholderia phytofirmans PsJN]MEE1920126.1 MarR family transcriptional regulator [Pseudomonas asiatica]
MKSEDENLPHSEFRLKDWRNARFVFLGNKLTLALAEMYEAEFDLSQTEWRIIAAVAEHAPMSAKDLAEFIVIDIFSITRATSALVKRGLLTRRVNQQDRRKIELRLSARGRKVYDQIVPVALAVERAVFSVLSKNESNQLDHILLKLEEHIGQLLTPDRSWKSFVADPKS